MNNLEGRRKEFVAIVGKHSKHWAYPKAETLEKLRKWVATEVTEAYKKGHIDGSIQVFNTNYNKLMDTDGVDDRRDDSAKEQYDDWAWKQ